MKAILKWQYEQLVKELILLQNHIADPTCPCETAGEMCVRKHLFTIEGYAQETIPIEESGEYREKLEKLAQEAKGFRATEEQSLRGERDERHAPVLDWSRDWRKQFEAYSLEPPEVA